MNSRSATPTCGPARPTPLFANMMSVIFSTSRRIVSSISFTGSAARPNTAAG